MAIMKADLRDWCSCSNCDFQDKDQECEDVKETDGLVSPEDAIGCGILKGQ